MFLTALLSARLTSLLSYHFTVRTCRFPDKRRGSGVDGRDHTFFIVGTRRFRVDGSGSAEGALHRLRAPSRHRNALESRMGAEDDG
ncbi:MAG: hypothetical protein AVDCRST_MAG04-535 [uncultured Acetobacteraceae bacterium]|uniref:Uncharacterized protein n=1 Tax=uncultured Acetobacteraceae bacterium TaxID=169975 RepID=A0A6J4HCY2_9PROT|nr:MAG: hypothetical protein AVDCRST_MAG04-535 [uncultured Acetobacteraceae bacterium]